VFTVSMNQMLGIFAVMSRSKEIVQGMSAFILLILVLFCGFIVAPDVIPGYYRYLYWWNPLAWTYRALLVNEFTSDSYGEEEGKNILIALGFVDSDGNAYGEQWTMLSFIYLAPYTLACLCLSGYILSKSSPNTGSHSHSDVSDNHSSGQPAGHVFDVPFTPVTLSFEDVGYEVKSSKGDGKLKILNGVNGVFRPGRMCALMGASGAGKTTLMDVIAMRKHTGTVTGKIRVNGFDQDPHSFRRSIGYVEQFVTVSSQLTVKESVLFSAKLRLAESAEVPNDDAKEAFVDHILRILELTKEKDFLIGTGNGMGLSFQQRKRLSIAIEMAASPSVIFLDEPTSGLESRAALIVMRSLKRIADTGRTVCATIHQPSAICFDMFDDLLLLRKGGEVVFFGETGRNSETMISYFESRGGRPIQHGENAANWMLNIVASGPMSGGDFADHYKQSDEYRSLRAESQRITTNRDSSHKLEYDTQYAVDEPTRNQLMNERLITIYWRSPAYNRTRLIICALVAFIISSVFVGQEPEIITETYMTSLISTIFIAFIMVGVLSITTVLPVMHEIREVFYRHRSSGMLDARSLALALGVAEQGFICLASALFCFVFYPSLGMNMDAWNFLCFWGFFTFNLAIYSYFGQAFMCSVEGMGTAQILASIFIGINNFFSGLIVRPQFMSGVLSITYWITPGHYVFEGILMNQYRSDNRTVLASEGTEFYNSLIESGVCLLNETQCFGNVTHYVDVFFGGRFDETHIIPNVLVLGLYLVVARLLTYLALAHFNYSST